jgi:hypothetical protein
MAENNPLTNDQKIEIWRIAVECAVKMCGLRGETRSVQDIASIIYEKGVKKVQE